MVYCCVPFCKSKTGLQGVSFHEFPISGERELWLKNISRQGETQGSKWIPSDRSKVCSIHFAKECFSNSTKRKALLPGTVPTIFPGYPAYFKKPERKTRQAVQRKTLKIAQTPVITVGSSTENITDSTDADVVDGLVTQNKEIQQAMGNCCVPLCRSSVGRPPGVTFHEFPSQKELRQKWISNINREGEKKGSLWIPQDKSTVCSCHFLQSSFSVSTTRKRLLPNSVPTVFDDYPEHLKRKPPPLPRRSPKERSTMPFISQVKSTNDNVPVNYIENFDNTVPVTNYIESGDEYVHSSSIGIQVSVPTRVYDYEARLTVRMLRRQCCRFRRQVTKLKCDLSLQKAMLKGIRTRSTLEKQFDKIVSDAQTKKSARALILYNHIKNYDKPPKENCYNN